MKFALAAALLKIDPEDERLLDNKSWYIMNGYVRGRHGGRVTFLHRVITNAPRGQHVDHINGDPLDNRRCNLRVGTALNCGNKHGLAKNNSSGFRGVFYHKVNGWCARVKIDRKYKHLGYYPSASMAGHVAKAYRLGFMPGATS